MADTEPDLTILALNSGSSSLKFRLFQSGIFTGGITALR